MQVAQFGTNIALQSRRALTAVCSRVVKSINTQISINTKTLYSDTVLICNSIEYQSYWRRSYSNL